MRTTFFKAATVLVISTIATISFGAEKPKFGPRPIESVPGEYVVRLKPNAVKTVSVSKMQERFKGQIKTTIPSMDIVVVRMPVIQTQQSAITTLAQNDMVVFAEPNYIYRANRTPNDPRLMELWGLKNVGQKDSDGQVGVAGVDIQAEEAWEITTGNKALVVAVIDTGVDYNHPDLKDNMWVNQAEAAGQAGVDDDGNGVVDDIHGFNAITGAAKPGDPMDDHGHGTHCAGTIGAKGNDGIGVAGVAWDASIMGIKFLSAEGGGTLADAVRAIDYANRMGAQVMSNSWGGGGFSQALFDIIQKTSDDGQLFIAAAGNDYSNNDNSPAYPASYEIENVISVAAIDNKGMKAGFSNFGKRTVHLGAPGVNILSSTGGAYDSWSGTSMATPHVSGVAALVWGHEMSMTAKEVKARLLATAEPISGLRGKSITGAMVNAFNAVTNTLPEPDMNDPMNWAKVSYELASKSPYDANMNQVYEINLAEQDGRPVSEMALFFQKFATETNYDTVKIYDSTGALVQTLTGNNDESFSANIKGGYAKLVFKTDDSVQGEGFKITQIAIR